MLFLSETELFFYLWNFQRDAILFMNRLGVCNLFFFSFHFLLLFIAVSLFLVKPLNYISIKYYFYLLIRHFSLYFHNKICSLLISVQVCKKTFHEKLVCHLFNHLKNSLFYHYSNENFNYHCFFQAAAAFFLSLFKPILKSLKYKFYTYFFNIFFNIFKMRKIIIVLFIFRINCI